MKKVISYLLVLATLIPCCKDTYAIKKGLNANHVLINDKNIDRAELDKAIAELKKDPQFFNMVKEIVLEVSKDKSVTDKASTCQEKTRKRSLWLKIAKIPFKVLWHVVKNTYGYLLGKNVSELLASLFPWALLAFEVKLNFPFIRAILDKVAAIINKA